MAKYFTYSEFTKSDTANQLGINNTPSEEYIQDNILEVMRVMDKIREKWTDYCEDNCMPNPQIIVNSGYRCSALNKALKGSKTSAHKIGSAVDFEAKNGQNKALFEVAMEVLKDIPFEEMINEKDYSWIHLALKSMNGEQKREIIGYDGKN